MEFLLSEAKKPKIHLWIFNHPYKWIADQVNFVLNVFKQNGYEITIGDNPKDDCLNVLIENFSPESFNVIKNYCTQKKKRISIIMTEHMDFENSGIYIHGNPLWSENDYMDPQTQVNRLRWLMMCYPFLRGFLTLGDLPVLNGISTTFYGIHKYIIPFPTINYITPNDKSNTDYDLLFTGSCTEYRKEILSLISNTNLSIYMPEQLVEESERDALNSKAKIILNIPQRASWKWLSSMRIIAALKTGKATISLGSKDDSAISSACSQIEVGSNKNWLESLQFKVGDWKKEYNDAYDQYHSMVNRFACEHPFPDQFFDFWAITESGINCE